MALRGNDMMITHNNTNYIQTALMPGYCGYIPYTKFMYGETFGNNQRANATIRYFQECRSGSMAGSKSPINNIGMFPSVSSEVTTPRQQSHNRAISGAYWSRFNVDFHRQMALQTFGQLCQKHRESYLDKTDTKAPIKHFVIPVTESDRYPREQQPKILLPCMAPMKETYREGARCFQTLPSGIRTSVEERLKRDVFFPRR